VTACDRPSRAADQDLSADWGGGLQGRKTNTPAPLSTDTGVSGEAQPSPSGSGEGTRLIPVHLIAHKAACKMCRGIQNIPASLAPPPRSPHAHTHTHTQTATTRKSMRTRRRTYTRPPSLADAIRDQAPSHCLDGLLHAGPQPLHLIPLSPSPARRDRPGCRWPSERLEEL
jgi:hypothetical protein